MTERSDAIILGTLAHFMHLVTFVRHFLGDSQDAV